MKIPTMQLKKNVQAIVDLFGCLKTVHIGRSVATERELGDRPDPRKPLLCYLEDHPI